MRDLELRLCNTSGRILGWFLPSRMEEERTQGISVCVCVCVCACMCVCTYV